MTDGGLKQFSISTVPGDFSGNNKLCNKTQRKKNESMYWATESKASPYYQCPLTPGTTYYLNIRTTRTSRDAYDIGN